MPQNQKGHTRRRLAGAWLSSLVSISLVLLLVGLCSLVLLGSSSITGHFKDQVKLTVMLSDRLTDEDAESFGPRLSAVRGVEGVTYISRAQGREEMGQMLGEGFMDIFEDAVIPVSYDLSLSREYVSKDSVALVRADLEAMEGVDSVEYDEGLVEAALSNVRKLTITIGIVIVLLLFISLVLIGNTVRVNVFARRFTIHTMKLVGATRGFIRRPFVWRAVLQGAVAAAIAFAILLVIVSFVRTDVPVLAEILGRKQLILAGGIMLVSGIALTTLSTWLSVTRLLSLPKDQLYY
ncbi:MAG: permease-like cell division protein FtsX [Bacteroidales bacterium]|nr:permease-like cell division protein FtsX [Bacteroidales bacterium]